MTQSLTNPDSSDPTSSIVPLTGPSLPPSRQSTRVITPVKTHPLYIRPNNDAGRSLATHRQSQSQSTNSEIQTAGHTQTTPVKSPRQRRVYRQNSGSQSKGRKHRSSAARSQKRKRGVIDDSDQSSKANSDPEISVMDLAQDSDNHNSKSKPTGKKTQGVAVTEFDDVALYFKAPTRAVGSTKGKKLWYKCRWCKKNLQAGQAYSVKPSSTSGWRCGTVGLPRSKQGDRDRWRKPSKDLERQSSKSRQRAKPLFQNGPI
ncbi:hypothetical protein Pst134EA_025573 [Puccinia striiformis f. sp. tritici]|uniref:hypothetical protein n=1 Tax=Puccinia striiformis f. sp. tritici TaxID=168172 RepID=UPI002007F02B|nr:hypothetical protein Pst134EA_025573 [Puccinia striiformis f. sp. tritici]KAH9451626.1 hypothetical protein Pst134EA_025573 [Puccinia striiformis f. sp. tritici]